MTEDGRNWVSLFENFISPKRPGKAVDIYVGPIEEALALRLGELNIRHACREELLAIMQPRPYYWKSKKRS